MYARRTSDKQLNERFPCLASEINNDLARAFPDRAEERSRYLIEEFLVKLPTPTVSAEERATRAIAKLLETECRNERTNLRLLTKDPLICGVRASEYLNYASRIIEKMIGGSPKIDVLFGSFSGGASTARPRSESTAVLKFRGKSDVTADAFALATYVADSVPVWREHLDLVSGCNRYDWFRKVEGNILFTVPKKSDIDRCACKEPDLNMYMQKGVGNFLRHRLLRYGIDLNDQTRNQELARLGSLRGDIATIDLSSASDSVTRVLVNRLLPKPWYILLDTLRSKKCLLQDRVHYWSLFSTMGNGFTFELESMIFYALVRAAIRFGDHGDFDEATKASVSVYGDDIILPVSHFKVLRDLLGYCGFILNQDKSFVSGRFRESCGKHWLAGVDVTPVYVKRPIDSIDRLVLVLNRLRDWGTLSGIVDPRLYDLWTKYARKVPREIWGGRDLTSPLSLVTPDPPRLKLKPVTRKLKYTHTGYNQRPSYLTWLNSPLGPVAYRRDMGKFTLQRNDAVRTSVPVFPKEAGYGTKYHTRRKPI